MSRIAASALAETPDGFSTAKYSCSVPSGILCAQGLVVCDTRLAQMGYGRRLRAALPPMTPLSSEEEALRWLEALAAEH